MGVIGLVIIIVVIGFVIENFINRSHTTSLTGLNYQTVSPGNTSIDKLDWRVLNPPTGEAVFAFADKIGDISINVTEQPIPESFKPNVADKVSEFAKQKSMTSELSANGTKIHIGISSKGPQSTVFTKNDLLIFIKSQSKIEDKDWISYVNSLN